MNGFPLQLIKKALTIPKTRQQLLQETKLPERTLRYNINILKKQGLIKERAIFTDMRRKVFYLNLKKNLMNK